MESRTVIDTPNCIWKPKELIECSKSLACNEIIKSGRISYQCEENKIYKEGRLCRKDDIRVLRKATPSDLAPFFEKHPEYEPVNKKYNKVGQR